MGQAGPRQELDQLIKERGESYASVSRLIGRNSSYVQQYIKRGSPVRLDPSDIAQLALHFEVPTSLFGGKISSGIVHRSTVTVPILLTGSQKEKTEKSRLVDEGWLRRLTERPAAVAIVPVDGDAMHPTLQEGDEVIVQRQRAQDNLKDGLYAIRGSSKVLVRRIALEPSNGRISVLTDHPSFPNWTGLSRRGVEIIGRVIWLGLSVR